MESGDGEKREIRRPMNAFLIFCKRHRSMVREKNPNLDNRSVTRILGDLWANLKEDEKSQYIDLAKQYKDAFMKANPDYKWHNPDRLLNIPTLKQHSPLLNMAKDSGGMFLSSKLADPSDMGGLSILMEGTSSKAVLSNVPMDSETDFLSSPLPSSSKTLMQLAEMCASDASEKKLGNTQPIHMTTVQKSLDMSNQSHSSSSEKHSASTSPVSVGSLPETTPLALEEPVCKNPPSHDCLKDSLENKPAIAVPEKRGNNPENVLPMSCGKEIVDHIIEKMYMASSMTSEKMKVGEKPKVQESQKETEVAKKFSPSQEQKEKTATLKTYPMLDKNSHFFSHREEFLKGENFRSRKRCYSEPCTDVAFSMHTVGIVGKSQIELQGLKGDEVDGNPDKDADDNLPVRKSKRRNRGQRYQELINEGFIQPSKERMATLKSEGEGGSGVAVPCKKLHVEDESIRCDLALTHDVLSVYPRQIRKRTFSESEKGRTSMDDSKRYKTGDFDLEAHIATLPPCSLEKLAKPPKRVVPKPRTVSESSVKSSASVSEDENKITAEEESKPKEIVLTTVPHFKVKDSDQVKDKGPIVGSRKRKARKHSITHLQKVDEKKAPVMHDTKLEAVEINYEKDPKAVDQVNNQCIETAQVINKLNANLDDTINLIKREVTCSDTAISQPLEGPEVLDQKRDAENSPGNSSRQDDVSVGVKTNLSADLGEKTNSVVPFTLLSEKGSCSDKQVCQELSSPRLDYRSVVDDGHKNSDKEQQEAKNVRLKEEDGVPSQKTDVQVDAKVKDSFDRLEVDRSNSSEESNISTGTSQKAAGSSSCKENSHISVNMSVTAVLS